MEKEKSLYEMDICEQIENSKIVCDKHGELSKDDLDITMDCLIVCGFCSINQEMDTRNDFDIDPTVKITDF